MTGRRRAALFLAVVVVCVSGNACSSGGEDDPQALSPGEYSVQAIARGALKLPADSLDDLEPGQRLASGDVDGDGEADLIVGVPGADGRDGGTADAGAVFVVPGAEAGSRSAITEAATMTIHGAVAGDNLGFAVAAGDINDDGIDDIVAGAINSNGIPEVRTDMGEVYIIYGGRGTAELDAREADVTVQPAEGFSHLGTSLATGDLNGDGIADLAMGAPFAGREEGSAVGGPRTTVGEVYVVAGGADLPQTVRVADGDEDLRLFGESEFEQFGQSVSIGDVDGDDSNDLLVGAPGFGEQDAGAAVAFTDIESIAGAAGSADGDWLLLGPEDGARLGTLVDAGLGGSPGLLSSSPTLVAGDRQGCGALFVVSGHNGGAATIVDAATSTIVCSEAGEFFPASITEVARAEVAIVMGSPHASSGSGVVVSIAGAEGRLDLSAMTGNEVVIAGDEAEGLGSALWAGDLDGDGGIDLAALSHPGGESARDSGTVYIISY